jgi:hypothetical protein
MPVSQQFCKHGSAHLALYTVALHPCDAKTPCGVYTQAPPPEESSESEPEVKETWFTIMQKRKREAVSGGKGVRYPGVQINTVVVVIELAKHRLGCGHSFDDASTLLGAIVLIRVNK